MIEPQDQKKEKQHDGEEEREGGWGGAKADEGVTRQGEATRGTDGGE